MLESPDQALYEVDALLEEQRQRVVSKDIGTVMLKETWERVDELLDMRNDIQAVRSLVDTETAPM